MSDCELMVVRLEDVVLRLEEKAELIDGYVDAYNNLRMAVEKLLLCFPSDGGECEIPPAVINDVCEAYNNVVEIDGKY